MEIIFENPDRTCKIISLNGETNVGKQTPDNLELLAEEGNGTYENTRAIYGRKATDVMKISTESFNSGLLYFEDYNYSREKIKSALELVGVKNINHVGENKNYYHVFMQRTEDPSVGFITQARFVSHFAMEYYFRDRNHPKQEQPIGVIDAVCGFVEGEIKKFGGLDNSVLYKQAKVDSVFGSLGLGFGFLVENSYYGIHRVWSRIVFYSK